MVGFHAGIVVLMGLPWFSLAMVDSDAMFLRDETWQRVANWFRRAASDPAPSARAPGAHGSGIAERSDPHQQPQAECQPVGV